MSSMMGAKRPRKWKVVTFALAVAGISLAAWVFWFFHGLNRDMRARSTLRDHRATVVITDRRGGYLDEIYDQGNAIGYWPLPVVPPKVKAAILAAEDRRFDLHDGVDLPSVARACWQYGTHRRKVSGASTIAMQTVRLEHPAPRGFRSKLVEALAAREMTRRYGRERVLAQYLAIAPFGPVYRGVAYASERYFEKPVADLGYAEAAFLCSLPQSPTRYDPQDPVKAARLKKRTRQVLGRLAEDRKLSTGEMATEKIVLDRLAVAPRPVREMDALHVEGRMRDLIGRNPGLVSGHHFLSSLDLDLQHFATEKARDFVYLHRHRGCDAVAILVADARSGEVLSYVGSPSYFGPAGSIDYVETKRSSGSALKPFIYGLGIDVKGFTGATVLTDAPASFAGDHGIYLPANADRGYLGPMLYREALANSRNLPAIELVRQIGMGATFSFLKTLGFCPGEGNAETYGLAMAVGSVPVTLWELTSAYGVLARHGASFALTFNRGGEGPVGTNRLMPEDTARLLGMYLSDPAARTPSFPRMSTLEYPFPVSIKTGTSFGYKDAWCMAYTRDHVLGVWVGSSRWQSMDNLTGANAAGSVLRHLIHRLYPDEMRGQHRVTLPPPEGYVAVSIDRKTGLPSRTGITEYFKPGAEPREPWGTVASTLEERITVAEPDYQAVITYPLMGSRILLDPALPLSQQTVTFKAKVSPSNETAVWYVDGRPFAMARDRFTCDWTPRVGAHTVQLCFASAPLKSSVVEITVE